MRTNPATTATRLIAVWNVPSVVRPSMLVGAMGTSVVSVFRILAHTALDRFRSRLRAAVFLTKALHHVRLAANAQEGALAVRALLQDLAGLEDLAAHFLRRPGEE